MTVDLSKYEIVRFIDDEIANLTDCDYVGKIYAAPGVIKHIRKRHESELSEDILLNIIDTIKNVLKSPEYVGTHPKKKGTSIEFVKK